MKKVPLKIFLASSFTALFVACTATGDAVRSDEDNSSSSAQRVSSCSVEESSSSKVKSSSSKILSSSSHKVIESSSSKVKSSSSKILSSSSSKIIESSFSKVISSSSWILSSSSSSKISSSSTISRLSIYDAVEESGLYTTKDSVAAYLCKFDKLPANYVGKDKGIALYESKTGNAFSKWNFNPWTTINVMIGGDKFSNNEGLLPEGSYHEADVDYSAKNRGTKRLIYQSDCVIYYTSDHYESFSKLEVR